MDSVIKNTSLIVLIIDLAFFAYPILFREPYIINPFLAILIAFNAIMFYIMGVAIEHGNR